MLFTGGVYAAYKLLHHRDKDEKKQGGEIPVVEGDKGTLHRRDFVDVEWSSEMKRDEEPQTGEDASPEPTEAAEHPGDKVSARRRTSLRAAMA